MIKKILIHIVSTLIGLYGVYVEADWLNNYEEYEDDKYLWRKQMKLGRFYHFYYSYGKPVRFKSYWMQKITQIVFVVYLILLMCLMGLCKFMNFGEALLLLYLRYSFLIIWMIPNIFRLGADAYVWIKECQNRKISDKKVGQILKVKMKSQGFKFRKGIKG